jgi:hypothetical protein
MTNGDKTTAWGTTTPLGYVVVHRHPPEINATPLRSVYDSDTVTKLFVAAGIAQLRRKGLRYLLARMITMPLACSSHFYARAGVLHGHFECQSSQTIRRNEDITVNKPPSPLRSTSCHTYHRPRLGYRLGSHSDAFHTTSTRMVLQ